MKVSHKFIAVLLAVALITQPFTFMAYAAEQPDFLDQTTVSSDTPEIPIKDSASDEAQIVSEVTEKRTENSKTFLLDNGTYLLASYGEPVHYKDSNGTWQDIDSTLGETGASGMPDVTDPLNPSSQSAPPSTADSEITSSAPNVSDPSSAADASDSLSTPNSLNPDAQAGTSRFFANKAGATKFNLTRTLKSANAISFSTEAYTLHWGLDGADTVPAEVIPDQTDVSSESYNDRFLKLRKLHSAVEYKDALPGVDVQYLLSSGAVKENLVLNSRDTQKRFTETYQIGKLRAEQTDKRTIKLFDPSDSKQKGPVYTIAAPEMTDANGAISGAISLSILKQDPSQGTLQVELKTDEAWLNDPGRAYPVTIDPIVWSQRSTTRDTFISSGHPTENESSMGSMYLGNESSAYKTCRVLVNFDLPALPKGDMVVGAQLNIEQHSSGMSPSSASMQVNAYEMTSSWNEKTATWSNTQAATQPPKREKCWTISPPLRVPMTGAIHGTSPRSSRNGITTPAQITELPSLPTTNLPPYEISM